ncbi:unnamed protein product [Plutella xylostella]|uniref:(diamondback moth) hypothetical protein n=1 Tax=Plutella xylostella TaxID=51655 RepID=A0A8S4EJD8_PLUXY|nr:unnamed protein product [Plutella xylostella]
METSDETARMRPKTMADLLPELTSLLSQDALVMTAKKLPRNHRTTMAIAHTTEKFKPLTIAEMRADIEAIKSTSKKKFQPQTTASTMKKRWNASSKLDKKVVSHTGDGQLKNNPVRKVLYFQTKTQPVHSRATMLNPETPKFPKPEARVKKPLYNIKAKETVRISGVYKISETPIDVKKPAASRFTMANKENCPSSRNIPKIPNHIAVNKKIMASPKNMPQLPSPRRIPRKSIAPRQIVPDTPKSNDSWKSSCDASFLQKEKEIHDTEEKAQAIAEEKTLEDITEVSPPVSTPFKEYRNVKEYFNNSSDVDTSANDNTIMCFDKPSVNKAMTTAKKEESVIVSLCDMLNKATVSVNNHENTKSELEVLLEIRKETENNIKSQTKLLKYVNKLINKKINGSNSPIALEDKTLVEEIPEIRINDEINPEKSPILCRRTSVIRSPSKSPSYKIPKKNSCLRKKVIYKSMPEMGSGMCTPKSKLDSSDRAMTMYMNMKEKMNFLNTPVVKQRPPTVPDTPALTSHNLQMQLDKLFNHS